MDSVDRLLKTIRGVSKTNPVTNLQLSEIIRRLWSDQGKIIQIIYNEIINNTSNIYQSITQIILNEKSIKITQTAHGFIVGDVIKPADPLWIKAKADTEANAKATAIVSEIIDDDNFKYIQGGLLAGDYTIGAKYLLSITTAGAVFIQSDPEIWTAGNYRQMIGTGTADGLLVEIDEGEVIGGGSHLPVTIAAESADKANIDENQVLTINNKLFELTPKGVGSEAQWNSPVVDYDLKNILVCEASEGRLYLSNDYGENFTILDLDGDLDRVWGNGNAISGDGKYLIAYYNTYGLTPYSTIYISDDYGDTWSSLTPYIGDQTVASVKINRDGHYMIMSTIVGNFYKSSDYGASWVQIYPISISIYDIYYCLINGDGSLMAFYSIGSNDLRVSVSQNYGVSWTETDIGTFPTDSEIPIIAIHASVCSINSSIIKIGIQYSNNDYGYLKGSESPLVWRDSVTNFGSGITSITIDDLLKTEFVYYGNSFYNVIGGTAYLIKLLPNIIYNTSSESGITLSENGYKLILCGTRIAVVFLQQFVSVFDPNLAEKEIRHNFTQELQGGSETERYHLTLIELEKLAGLTKATGAEVTTGTDDAKYLTPKSITDSNVVQGTNIKKIVSITQAAHEALIAAGTTVPTTLYIYIP